MARLAVDDHLVAAPVGQRVGERSGGIEAGALLVQRRRRQVGAETHGAGIGRERSGEQVEQRRLAGAVRPDDAEPVAAQDARREIGDDARLAIGFRRRLRLDDERARGLALRGRQFHIPGHAPVFAALAAEILEPGKATLVALAPRGDAVAEPVLLLDDAAGELVLLKFLLGQPLVAPGLEGGEAAIELARGAAIQPGRRPRQLLQQPAVVADDDDGRAERRELRFQPLDRRQVEMIGRLVEQQDVGRGGERTGERGAARLATREPGRGLVAGQSKLLEQIAGAVTVVARA